jgi:hypothetical protein
MQFPRNCFAIAPALLALFTASASGQMNQSFDPGDEASCNKAVGPRDDSSAIGLRGWIYGCGQADQEIEKREFGALSRVESAALKEERQAYQALLGAFEKYRGLALTIDEKRCGGGTGCGAGMSVDEASFDYWFLLMAQGFRRAGFPPTTEKDFADADAKLNGEFQNAIADSPMNCPGNDSGGDCVSRQQLRAMERAWLAYRESWVAYGALKWPSVTPLTFRTLLTRRQAKWLSQY